MPPKPLIASDRLRSMVTTSILVAVLGCSLAAAWAFTLTHQSPPRSLLWFDEMSLLLPSDWQRRDVTSELLPNYRLLVTFHEPQPPGRMLVVASRTHGETDNIESAMVELLIQMSRSQRGQSVQPRRLQRVLMNDRVWFKYDELSITGDEQVARKIVITEHAGRYWIVGMFSRYDRELPPPENDSQVFNLIFQSVEFDDAGEQQAP